MIKNLIILIFLLILVGCNDTEYVSYVVPAVKKEIVNQNFEQVWVCDNNSLIEIYVDADNRIYIESQGQQINSINKFDVNQNNYSRHPSQDVERLQSNSENKFTYERNINYSSGNNLRRDANDDLITGNRRTKYEFELNNDAMLLKITIYDKLIGESNPIVFTERELNCE